MRVRRRDDEEAGDVGGGVGDAESSRPLSASEREELRALRRELREARRLRMRRHGRRAYIRSVYFLPSLATLGNAVCGFAAIYVAMLVFTSAALHVGAAGGGGSPAAARADSITQFFTSHGFSAAAYLIFFAMVFDALDGRLARFARHTTDFGGQLDSLADVVSFGVAPGIVALSLVKIELQQYDLPFRLSRLIWAVGAMYMCCAAVRLARFNVSNEHGEQHHFSFLGLPSPGAAGAVAGLILAQQELRHEGLAVLRAASEACVLLLPIVVLASGLLMVSHLRYPHVVNRYLRGKHPIGRLIVIVALGLLLVTAHQYTIGAAMVAYMLWGPVAWVFAQVRRRQPSAGRPAATPDLPPEHRPA